MQKPIFIPNDSGDTVRADHVVLCNPDPHDPGVADSSWVSVILINCGGCRVRARDLRRALDIVIEPLSATAEDAERMRQRALGIKPKRTPRAKAVSA